MAHMKDTPYEDLCEGDFFSHLFDSESDAIACLSELEEQNRLFAQEAHERFLRES